MTSWVTSSDWAGSRITRLTTPNTDGPICSKTASKAVASPRATRAIWPGEVGADGAAGAAGAGRARFLGSWLPVAVTTDIRSSTPLWFAVWASGLARDGCGGSGGPVGRAQRIWDVLWTANPGGGGNE